MTDPDQPINPAEHFGLVFEIAMVYRGRGMDLDDLVGEGSVGLIEASRSYDPARHGFRDPSAPVPFHRFASWRIHGAIRSALRERSKKHIPIEHDGETNPVDPRLPDPLSVAELRDEWRLVERLMEGMPPQERRAILARFSLDGTPPPPPFKTVLPKDQLSDDHGLIKFPLIAERLGVTERHACWLYNSGMKRLRKQLGITQQSA